MADAEPWNFCPGDGPLSIRRLAQRLFEVYRPIARTSVDLVAGMAIDLAHGFVMARLFLLPCSGLPGATGLLKGVSFALLAWVRC